MCDTKGSRGATPERLTFVDDGLLLHTVEIDSQVVAVFGEVDAADVQDFQTDNINQRNTEITAQINTYLRGPGGSGTGPRSRGPRDCRRCTE